MEKDNTIKWDKNYIEQHFEENENTCKYCTCKIEEFFDPDSDEKVVNHYIDFFFDIIEEKKNKAKIIKTNKIWDYCVSPQEGSGRYEILLKDENSKELILRGDTLGTYKSILGKFEHKVKTENLLSKIDGLDLKNLEFCTCNDKTLLNNSRIGSFFIIPKPNRPRASINTQRAREPYKDNFFMFLELVKTYINNKTIDCDNEMKNLFDETKIFWNLFKNFEDYIECLCFQPFIDIDEKLKKELNTSPNSWNIQTVNTYIKTINDCILKREELLKKRIGN
ncbi:hypothetical protein V1L52_01560 [Treponema sp. HNW]|uniref:DUF6994 family protein n=1 Tax=Treponema sp. HNW TaxID=3116654 RepID=UPI003D118ACB